MGKYLEKFKQTGRQIDQKMAKMSVDRPARDDYEELGDLPFEEDKDLDDLPLNSPNFNEFGDVGLPPAQKPESFHHFILENQYRDLERSIRGYKDIYDKQTEKIRTVRKSQHCFTDEEAEEILRTAQSHLSTDIKLSFIHKDAFPILMDTIYQEISMLFESIAEYRYGRYGDAQSQYEMKLQNHKIFLELFTRIQANYSRAISGTENNRTHDSVKGQESLNQSERDFTKQNKGYY